LCSSFANSSSLSFGTLAQQTGVPAFGSAPQQQQQQQQAVFGQQQPTGFGGFGSPGMCNCSESFSMTI